MALSPFDYMMLAVVAVKVLVALLFLRWLDHHRTKPDTNVP